MLFYQKDFDIIKNFNFRLKVDIHFQFMHLLSNFNLENKVFIKYIAQILIKDKK